MKNLEETQEIFTLRRIGTPIEPEMRPLWKIGLISMILHYVSRSSRASSTKILALCSILGSKKKALLFEQIMNGNIPIESLSVRFDPSVNRAIDLGIGEEIFAIDDDKKIFLTEKGKKFAKKIDHEKGVFELEKKFLSQFSKNDISEMLIERIIKG